MVRRSGASGLVLAAGCAAALLAASTCVPSFVGNPGYLRPLASSSSVLEGEPSATALRAATGPSALPQVTACLSGCGLAVCAAALLAAGRRAKTHPRSSVLPRRAEDESGFSILGGLRAEQDEEKADADKAAQMESELFEMGEDSLDSMAMQEEESAEEASRRGARQVTYNLYPSRQYVLYIAKQNALRNWTKDGPGGRNKGCMEVQIAVLTERIRSMVMHVREFKHDYKCRMKLVSMVSRRRRLLDKLSWKDLDSYINIRKALAIRHTYRMEALIGRLPAYKFAIRDRKQAPGRKVSMRLKKTQRLLTTRLASQLRQGRKKSVIHATRKALKSRRWLSREYDEAANLIAGRENTEYMDPLNMP